MNMRAVPALGISPADVAAMPPEAVPALLLELAALQTAAAARLAVVPEHRGDGEAGMLTAEQAAAAAGVTREEFYRRAVFRTAIVKLGHRTIRVNERKLRRILAASKGA